MQLLLLHSLQLLPLLLMRVLVAAQRLRVGELSAAVLTLVFPLLSSTTSASATGSGGPGVTPGVDEEGKAHPCETWKGDGW
ncbi:hypothetical protein C4D60_Mb08t18020 [Musa balbisiana]|uniref:Secreted protein n=1 Tax=Musa balbisiana TaxID=52838 RepID=A0A4S8K4L7_MUSBA|nr:hypothetical protein C4D60_Mb08t18020 [Musa balbisiana]